MPQSTAIEGNVAPGFEPVADAFRENFSERGEVGAAVCVRQGERTVVDLWGGTADREWGTPWRADTLSILFSATKGLSALVLLILGDRGKLDWDAPVSQLWPEFAQAGKEAITLRTLMNHRAGVVGLETPLTLADFADLDRIALALARQRPLWEPGTDQGYHAITMGAYANEIVRRAEGRTLGRFLADEVAGPLGADVYVGLPPEHEDRVATLYPGSIAGRVRELGLEILLGNTVDGRLARGALRPNSLARRALSNPRPGPHGLQAYNQRFVRALELPWANGMGSARGLARVYGALAGGGTLEGVTLCSPESLAAVHPRQSWAEDRILCKPMGFSQGFVKEEPHVFSPATETFGHPGMGGSLGFADPTRELAFGYVLNRMDYRLRSPRALALCHALYRCVD